MVTIIPYGSKTQATAISPQNSGGNGYVGNAGMQALGQAIGGVADRALGIDDESKKRQELQDANRNKFEAEIEERERQRFMQSEKISAYSKLADLDLEVGAEAETLKSKIGAGADKYTDSFAESLDKKIGLFTKDLSFHQKEFLAPQLVDFKARRIADAKSYERTESINNNIANVQKVQKSLLDKVSSNSDSANDAIAQNEMMIETLGLNPDVARKLSSDFEDTARKQQITLEVEADPQKFLSKFQPKATTSNVSSFENSIDKILKTEGGYVAKDGRSNAPAIYGINEKYNPDLYEKIKKLYDAGRTDEAINLAKTGYKDRYWDAINADSLPEDLRHIAVDTAINQGVSIANKLIKESNGDLDKFAELRIAEYKKINQPENIKGWVKRVNDRVAETKAQSSGGVESQQPTLLEREAMGGAGEQVEEAQKKEAQYIKLLIQDGKINYKQVEESQMFQDSPGLLLSMRAMQDTVDTAKVTAQKAIDRENNRLSALKKNDAGQYVIETTGKYDAQKIYEEQVGVPINVRKVLPNEISSEFSANLQNVRSLDDLMQWHQSVEQTVNNDALLPNAYKQMELHDNLPREYKTVLMLDPYDDSEEIRYIFNSLSSGKEDFKQVFDATLNANLTTPSDFKSNFDQKTAGIMDIKVMQGESYEGIRDSMDSIKLIAEAHYIKHKDADKAIEFAKNSFVKKYYNDGDELEQHDGKPILLPIKKVNDKNQALNYLDIHKENIVDEIFYVSDIENRPINESTKEQIVDNAYYGENETGDGLVMFAETGLMLLDKNKQPIQVFFNDINKHTIKRPNYQQPNMMVIPRG